jgi:hypothetical protein
MRKVLVIIIILSLLATRAVYARDGVCLRVPIERDRDRIYISMLTEQVKSSADILKVLRPSTRKILSILERKPNQKENKGEILRSLLESHDVKFDVMLFYELYSLRNFHKWDNYERLKYLAAKRDDFVLQMVIHAAVLEKLGLSPNEMLISDQYISVPNDSDNETVDPKLSAKVLQVILGKSPKRDYDVLSRYFEALSAMALEVNKYGILAKDDIDDVFFTRTERSGYGLLNTYIAARESATETSTKAIGNLFPNPAGSCL